MKIKIILISIFCLSLILSCTNSFDKDKEKTLPNDVELYLKESEAKFKFIRSSVEKTIIWAHPLKKDKTNISIIYIHGFSASRQETAPVSDIVARNLDANLFYTRLTGHGLDGNALAKAAMKDWLNDAIEALDIGRKIGNKVIIIGTSTGGTLATWLANRADTANIAGFVLLSPNFGVKDLRSEFITLPGARYIIHLLVGKNRTWKPINQKAEECWTYSYPYEAAIPMIKLVKMVRNSDLERINLPVVTIFSPNDKTLDVDKILKTIDRFSSKEKKVFKIKDSQDKNNHILAGDILSPVNNNIVVKIITDFCLSIQNAFSVPR